MRMAVAETIVETLEAMGLAYPEVEDHLRERFDDMRSLLDEEGE
jgi:hypothetical protein